jgi:hypothetical protein
MTINSNNTHCELCRKEIFDGTNYHYEIDVTKGSTDEHCELTVCDTCNHEFVGLKGRLSREDLVDVELALDEELHEELRKMSYRANVSIEDMIKVILCLHLPKMPNGMDSDSPAVAKFATVANQK